MDATRIHLTITHFPVFGLFLGFAVLLYGMIRKDRGVKIVSHAIIIISIVGGLIAFQTGESAEERVENVTGIIEDTIEEHEESAEITILFFYGLGALTLASLYSELKSKWYSKQMVIVVMACTALTFSFVAWTASLGGKIRHTEINNKSVNQVDGH
jgi:hypothetical protein